jgi:hypothetical protein
VYEQIKINVALTVNLLLVDRIFVLAEQLCSMYLFIFVLCGGVRLSPLSTLATNWPIVPAPDDT